MSTTSDLTNFYVCYYGADLKLDTIVHEELVKCGAEWVNSGTFLSTGQRDHVYAVHGRFDQFMCHWLADRLSGLLNQAVLVTTRFEDTDLGKSMGGIDWRWAEDDV